jgi:hypothetical protein
MLLSAVAQGQGGYFSAAQARKCGFWYQNQHRYVDSGEWVRYLRGIYRLALLPEVNFGEYFALALFFRHRDGRPAGVFALESAMFVRGIGDFLPNQIKVAVKNGFRKWAHTPPNIEIVSMDFSDNDYDETLGYPVMQSLPTILQLLAFEVSERHLVKAAFFECRKKGVISPTTLTHFLSQDRYKDFAPATMISEWENELTRR